MWLDGNIYVNKRDESDENEVGYKNVLKDLGLDDNVQSIDDIADKARAVIRISEITTIIETKFPNVVEITLVDERFFFIEGNFQDIKEFVYENSCD